MNFAIRQEDVEYLRAYVTAKDGHENDEVEPGIVCFDITHNYLKVRMHGIRMPLSSTVLIPIWNLLTNRSINLRRRSLCIQERQQNTNSWSCEPQLVRR